MIELLVALAIIGILTTLIVTGAQSALEAAKKRNTLQVMQNGMAAIDVFASENPLGGVYNSGPDPGFGNLPPYQLARSRSVRPTSRPQSLQEAVTGSNTDLALRHDSLSIRLYADLSGRSLAGTRQGVATGNWVRFPNEGDGHDDARALTSYLSVFSPRALDALPPSALRPLDPLKPDYVNPRGDGGSPGDAKKGWRDVNVLHDGWGVPLDYFMYVKVGVGMRDGGREVGVRVLDRRPVLMSRGVDREFYDESERKGGTLREDPKNWLFSEPLPTPVTDAVEADGDFDPRRASNPAQFRTGWVRLIADENPDRNDEDFVPGLQPAYLPKDDIAP